MQRKHKVEDVYLESAHQLRKSLPRFAIFLGAVFLVWIFGSSLLIPLGTGIQLGRIEASKIVNIIVLGALVVLVITSFREIKLVANAMAGFVTYYIGNSRGETDSSRLEKLKTTFRSFAYVILVSILFLAFKPLLSELHPVIPGIIVIVITIWSIIALYGVVMALSGEIEEAASAFAERIEKRARKRK